MLICLFPSIIFSTSKTIVNIFENPNNDMPLQKLVVDKTTERIYVGGVNYIYDLKPSLEKRVTAITGHDNEFKPCSDIKLCAHDRVHLKAMAVYAEGSKLIECPSTYPQCRLRNLYDITTPDEIKGISHSMIYPDETASTVILVGMGPPNPSYTYCQPPENYDIWKNDLSQVLYIGSTILNNNALQLTIPSTSLEAPPSIASYKLNGSDSELFNLAIKSVGDGTELKLLDKNYKIDYISAFQSGAFIYFSTQQLESFHNEFNGGLFSPEIVSKLVRIYVNDHHFHSYTEVPLICKGRDGYNYKYIKDTYLAKPEYTLAKRLGVRVEEDVLFAIFSDQPSNTSPQQVVNSALCVYSMDTVERIFKDNIRNCFRGKTSRNLKWFVKNDKCSNTTISESQMICGSDAIRFIGGEKRIDGEVLMNKENTEFTSIVVHSVKGFTVGFIGTVNGKLLKVAIQKDDFYIYNTIDISNNPILPDMELDGNNEYLYVLTSDRLTKLAIKQCGDATDCKSCLEMRDPYCGWCGISGMCVSEDQCVSLDIPPSPTEFFSQNGKCPVILSIFPNSTQISTTQNISIVMQNIPQRNYKFIGCRFEFPYLNINVTQPAAVIDGFNQKIYCQTPDVLLIPTIPIDEMALNSKLNIIRTNTNTSAISLASTNFTFYDCRKLYSCKSCVESSYPCSWCIQSSQCVEVTSSDATCKNQNFVHGIGTSKLSNKGSLHCPQIVEMESTYIRAGEAKQFTVTTKNTHSFMKDWVCIIKNVHEIIEVSGNKVGDQIICDSVKMDYTNSKFNNGTLNIEIVLAWASKNQRQPLDNIFKVNLYKCNFMADNCGSCLLLDNTKFNCGWCESTGKCSPQSACLRRTDFLKTGDICANPKIINFYPKKGPLNGGTELTIIGNNLGRQVSDVDNNVFIGNVRCSVITSKYVPFSKIVCKTGDKLKIEQNANLPRNRARSHPIIVQMETKKGNLSYTATSNEPFVYVDPLITTFSPRQGPLSGGTIVTIKGENLDAGSHVRTFIGGSLCKIVSRNITSLICQSGSNDSPNNSSVHVVFDDTPIEFKNLQFEYKPNPKFLSIDKEMSIVSGGISITVKGVGFHLIQSARMVFGVDDQIVKGYFCNIEHDTSMNCTTPNIQNVGKIRPTNSNPLSVNYGYFINEYFYINDSRSLQNYKQISVYPDPTLESIKDIRYFLPGGFLTINGESLNKVASESDIKVDVSGNECKITALADKALTCQLPNKDEIDETKFDSLGPEVLVKIGSNVAEVGRLSFDPKATKLTSQFLFIIILAVVLFFIAFLILLILFKRKSTSHNRQLKYLRSQMDTIEMRVATECKEAFAELQTSMSAWQENYPQGQIYTPFLSYKDYASRILFPHNYPNNPIFAHLEVDSEHASAIEAGLQQFNKLLCNKTFLLTFVQTMEKNKYFVGKDRVNVGSLLMVVLQDKMEYCTDILKQLLKELILKNVEGKYQPKVLFRRSESVAERMLSAWFAFFMYKFLRDCGGQQLFQLYWSLKQTTEKGPQDAITMDARYSLSEEKLLRSTIDYQELIIHIISDEIDSPQSQKILPQEFTIRAISCDTISQVKEKCLDAKYRTLPFSERPSIDDIDLEWVTPSQSIILRDIDNSNKIESGGWKKINTLSHYKIPTNARLLLIPRQIASSYNLSLMSDRSEKSSLTIINNSPTLGRGFGTNSSNNSKECSNHFHLVKPQENGPSDHQEKLVSEVYLTRLLTMKGTVQKFIEDFFNVIFSSSGNSRQFFFPICIKYMFDFMDEQALEHGITDEEVVHAWKSNALPLRFWVNLIKNPHFLFDIPKPTKIEGSLNVIAQTLMDACSTQEQNLTKDSPSSKLLFAKDIPSHRMKVNRYYSEIRRMPPISEHEMSSYFADESKLHQNQFYIYTALNELYSYVEQYKESIYDELSTNEYANSQGITAKFQQMIDIMSIHNNLSHHYTNGSLDGYNSASRLMFKENRFY
uniref:Plexin-A4 (inferred by orthology to a human protein) n=1 Tax=Strongyloides venezuelensis TaxID=75913 RepID=A0A0K0FCK3_STRVS